MSVYAVDTTTGKVLLDEESDKSLNPGSSIKVITTAAALSLLDPEEHFYTELEHDGTVGSDGVLHGNLYIRGGEILA